MLFVYTNSFPINNMTKVVFSDVPAVKPYNEQRKNSLYSGTEWLSFKANLSDT